MGLALLISGILLFFAGSLVSGIAALLIMLLMTLPPLEIMKIESKSGYDKYVHTLPVSRKKIVQSHYTFYLIVAILGALLSFGFVFVYHLLSDSSVMGIFNIIAAGIFIVLFAGALIYPLLYIFGAEKSDAIVLSGGIVGLIIFFGLRSLMKDFVEQLSIQFNPYIFLSIIFILLGFIIFILSYFVAVNIYHKKEF